MARTRFLFIRARNPLRASLKPRCVPTILAFGLIKL
jgi:hypothetical protein